MQRHLQVCKQTDDSIRQLVGKKEGRMEKANRQVSKKGGSPLLTVLTDVLGEQPEGR